MNSNFESWQEELLSTATPQEHKKTLAEIEIAILESPAADNCAFRLKAFWLMRHIARLL